MNVLLISYDTLRADAVKNGFVKLISDQFGRGTQFARAFAVAPLTPVSHATIFTGVLPNVHGIRHLYREKLRREIPTLAEAFLDRGYRTGAFVSCAGLDRWYGFSRGFQIYDDDLPRLPDGRRPVETANMEDRGKTYRIGSETIRPCLDWLSNVGSRFFCFLHLFDPHLPYQPQAPFDRDFPSPYLGEVAFAAACAEQILERLATMKILGETLIVLLGDHGEDLGEHGLPEGPVRYEEGHGALLTDVTTHVPLSFIGPDIQANRIVSSQVSLVDVAPTILEYLGWNSTFPLDGRSLVPALKGQEISNGLAWLETHYPEELAAPVGPLPALLGVRAKGEDGREIKSIWTPNGNPIGLYDLTVDPEEKHNLLEFAPRSLLRNTNLGT